jgi:hypothetical protein
VNISSLRERFEGISEIDIVDYKTTDNGYLLKARITFTDKRVLQVRELLSAQGRKYSYHLQDVDGAMVCRWDNSPKHPEVESFPHHYHEAGIAKASWDITLEDVLMRIGNASLPPSLL